MEDVLLIIIVGVGCVGFIFLAAFMLFPFKHESGWRRWLTITGGCLVLAGCAGFFGSVLSGVGGLNWLPSSFEWPMGYVTGVITTPGGLRVVPHPPSGRIQVYNADWSFRTGWHAGGKISRVLVSEEGYIEVMMIKRNNWNYVYNTDGRLISKNTYIPKGDAAYPKQGESVFVHTAPWLLVFSSPFISLAVAVVGMVLFNSMQMTKK